MTLSLAGDVALVTGAGGGLGRTYALELARRGASVVVNDLGVSVDGTGGATGPAQAVVDEIVAAGGRAVADTGSVAVAEGAEAMVRTAIAAFGRLDIVVNNAGIIRDEAMHKLTDDAWAAVTAVHLTGTMLVSRAAFRHMRERGYGRIVNTTSPAGLYGNFGQASYGAAKMGVVGLTRALSIEGAAKGVLVNAVAPGGMTRMTEGVMGSLGDTFDLRPELVAPVVAYLAHKNCELTGEVLSAAFGRVARVVIGSTPGYFSRDLTVEDIEAHLSEIMSDDGLTYPRNLNDEVALALVHYQTSRA